MLVVIGKLGINVQKSFSSWLWLLKLGWKVRQINSICFVNYQPNKVCETLNKNTFCICFEQYAKFILVLWYCTDLLLLSLLPNFIMMHVCVVVYLCRRRCCRRKKDFVLLAAVDQKNRNLGKKSVLRQLWNRKGLFLKWIRMKPSTLLA